MHQSLDSVGTLSQTLPGQNGNDLDIEPQLEPASTSTRLATLVGVAVPFIGFVAAVVFMWGRGFDWMHLVVFLSMYVMTAVGVTVGYHRYFTHKSFGTVRAVEAALAILGGMALEGPVLKWAAMHRYHHQHSDKPGDPHSPHTHHHGADHDDHGPGIVGVVKGFWHAHMGWMFLPDPKDLYRYVPDLSADRLLRVLSNLWLLWAGLGVAIPAAIGFAFDGWRGALLGFLWGGLGRIFLVHHVTWSINSVCHLWGTRPFRSHDLSRNNAFFGVIGLGEGWHNNHHAFPTSARHGLRWWEIDVSYYIIRGLALVHLAWDVKLPSQERLLAKRA